MVTDKCIIFSFIFKGYEFNCAPLFKGKVTVCMLIMSYARINDLKYILMGLIQIGTRWRYQMAMHWLDHEIPHKQKTLQKNLIIFVPRSLKLGTESFFVDIDL